MKELEALRAAMREEPGPKDSACDDSGDFVIISRVKKKGLLRLMGQSIAIGGDGVNDRVNGKEDDRVNDRVNDGVAKAVLETIAKRPGVRTNEIATHIGKSIPTVSRYIKTLKESGEIEYRGAPKNGGYYVRSGDGI